MQDRAASQGTRKGAVKSLVTGPSVLISHGQVTEQPQATNPLGLWPKRIAEGSNQGAVRGMREGVGAGGTERAPRGQNQRSSEPIGEVGA